jgi:hypothetical protein
VRRGGIQAGQQDEDELSDEKVRRAEIQLSPCKLGVQLGHSSHHEQYGTEAHGKISMKSSATASQSPQAFWTHVTIYLPTDSPLLFSAVIHCQPRKLSLHKKICSLAQNIQ